MHFNNRPKNRPTADIGLNRYRRAGFRFIQLSEVPRDFTIIYLRFSANPTFLSFLENEYILMYATRISIKMIDRVP